MGFSFRKSLRLGKRGRVTASKSGIGFSWGIPGLKWTKTSSKKKR